ncbi:histidine kinase [Streptomyces sp. NPDC004609]|uniref:histidine kinase n=1 Tax=Streptomyces sp. NPDC004609 TaxID=3364704 RepID=UPI0036B86E71
MWGSGTIWLVIALAAAVGVAGCLGAAVVRARRLHQAAIEERGWLLERERESATRTAVDTERARIATELHDIVSHKVSLMVVQAGAAREVLATMPEEAAAAMSAVETAGRNTMTELRHLLGLLAPAQNGDDEPYDMDLSPQPSLSRLSPLIDRIAFAGLPVEMRISGEPRPLPTGIDVQQEYERRGMPMRLRNREEAEASLGGLEMVEPGLKQVHHWRPDEGAEVLDDRDIAMYGAVARKG